MTDLTRTARSRRGSGRLADIVFRGSSRIAAGVVVALLILIGLLLFVNSRLTWQTFGLGFITGTEWDPVAGIYGAFPFIVGTILAATIAVVLAAPIGIFTAIYLSELAPGRLATPLTFMIELLAAIPSVVIGLWGVFILAPFLRGTVEAWIVSVFGWIPFFGGPAYGIGLFSAGCDPDDHDPADDRDHLARGHRGGARIAARGDVRARCDALGDDPACGHAVRPVGHHRRRDPGPRPGARRDDGRDDGHRQPGRDPELACSTRPRRSPRRSRRRSARRRSASRRRASSPSGSILLVMTIIMNVIARLLVWRVAGPVAGE